VLTRRSSYDDDNSHVAVVTQSVVQDIFWVAMAADKVREIRSQPHILLPKQHCSRIVRGGALWLTVGQILDLRVQACLVERGNDGYIAIVGLTAAFMDEFGSVWKRLAKDCKVSLDFHDEVEGSVAKAQRWYVCPVYPPGYSSRLTSDRRCTIVEHPDGNLLAGHPVESFELVLQAQVSRDQLLKDGFVPKAFQRRTDANRALATG